MLRFAAHCYVCGIRLSTSPMAALGMKGRNEEALTASVDLLPRLLHLLTFEDRDGEGGMLGRVIGRGESEWVGGLDGDRSTIASSISVCVPPSALLVTAIPFPRIHKHIGSEAFTPRLTSLLLFMLVLSSPPPVCVYLSGVVGDEVQRAVEERSLPPWIWFMWIPQLLTSLTRPEANRVRPILRQLAEVSVCGGVVCFGGRGGRGTRRGERMMQAVSQLGKV